MISIYNSVYMSFYQYSIIGLAHQTKDKYWLIDSQSTLMEVKPLPKLTSMVTMRDIIGPSRLDTLHAKLFLVKMKTYLHFFYYFLINTVMACVAIIFFKEEKDIFDTVNTIPDSKVHGANMGPTWVLSAPDGPHAGPMNLAIRDGCWWTNWQCQEPGQ